MTPTPFSFRNACSAKSAFVPQIAAFIVVLLLSAASYGQATDAVNSKRECIDEMRRRMESRSDHTHQHAGHDHAGNGVDTNAHGGACVELTELSIMFQSNASAEEVSTFLEGLPEQSFAGFLAQGSRWTSTATNGSVTQGQRLTLTYSFVPDGIPVQIAGFDGAAESELFALLDGQFPGGRAAWKAKFAQAFNRWGELINVTYVEVSDDGAAFPSSPGLLGSATATGRGDIRIGMRPLGEPLAVNFFPQFGGDMVLDSEDISTFVNSFNDFRSLRNVLMHEHGHGIGLNHVVPNNNTKLMEPFLANDFDGPQEDDTRGAQFIYGDWAEPNETAATAEFLGGTLRSAADAGTQVLSAEDVALERSDAADFYSFTCFAGVPIAIMVEPVGTTYDFAPQSNPTNVTTVDAAAVRNLGVRLWRRTSAQNQTFELMAQIDFSEAGQPEYHPPVPYSVAGFMVAEVYSLDSVNSPQRYSIRISNAAIAPIEQPASMRVFNTSAGQEVLDGTTVQFGQVNLGSVANRTLTILNEGPGTLQIGQISLAGPGAGDYSFSLIGNPVQSGDSASLAVAYAPSAAGVRQAVMTVPSNDPDQPNFSLILSGTGVQPAAPVIAVSVNGVNVAPNGAVAAGEIQVGDTASLAVAVRNNGNAPLIVTNVNFFGAAAADFATNATQANLTPGGTVTLTVTITPSAIGQRTAKLRIFNNSAVSPFLLDLSVNAIAAPIIDCNGNGVDDAVEINSGSAADCNANGIPDACEPDSDGDGQIDACDACPDDAAKTQPGACGCGVADIDSDGNGVFDCNEPITPAPNFPGQGLCGSSGASALMGMLLLCLSGTGVRRRSSGGSRRARHSV